MEWEHEPTKGQLLGELAIITRKLSGVLETLVRYDPQFTDASTRVRTIERDVETLRIEEKQQATLPADVVPQRENVVVPLPPHPPCGL